MNKFYLVCPIGLEEAVIAELRAKAPKVSPEAIQKRQGGVEVECSRDIGLALNYSLKTPTRILMRLEQKRCRDFPKLYKIIARLPWRKYLVQERAEWRVSSRKSRIINTEKAKQTCESALKKYFQGSPLGKKTLEKSEGAPNQKIYVRLDQDDLAISLDTSGELLHIRGASPDRGKASIRESYAACLLTLLFKEQVQNNQTLPLLVDPMCGTGSFLKEALDYGKTSRRGEFPFNRWQGPPPSKPDETNPLARRCLGLDLEPKIQNKKNLETWEQDVFADLPVELKKDVKGAALVCNPPYGKRIKIKGGRKKYFERLIAKIETNYSPCLFGIIIPADVKPEYSFDEIYPFNNNGVKVNFCVKRNQASPH